MLILEINNCQKLIVEFSNHALSKRYCISPSITNEVKINLKQLISLVLNIDIKIYGYETQSNVQQEMFSKCSRLFSVCAVVHFWEKAQLRF